MGVQVQRAIGTPPAPNSGLWVLDVTTGNERRVVSVDYDLRDVQWFPGGGRILVTANAAAFERPGHQNAGEIWAIDVMSGRATDGN